MIYYSIMNTTDHNRQNKIAVINDLSGFGRCSLAVALPIISQMRVQCCPVPTSIFSAHTGFPAYFFDDYTDRMQPYIDKWKALDLHFNGILTGFLGSDRQIDIVENFIMDFKDDNTLVIIDPVIGDNGRPYPTYTASMCEKMRSLVKHADILTPNLTEACILTSTDYRPDMSLKNICDIAIKLTETGAGKVVITGLDRGSMIANVICEKGHKPKIIRQKRCGHERSGTGDVFASIIAASAVLGYDFELSVRKASHFVRDCIAATEAMDIPPTDGVCFEEVLHTLK